MQIAAKSTLGIENTRTAATPLGGALGPNDSNMGACTVDRTSIIGKPSGTSLTPFFEITGRMVNTNDGSILGKGLISPTSKSDPRGHGIF